MKDKFEEAITKCRWEDAESGKSGIDERWAARECNTLHQQAMKDILIRINEEHAIYMIEKIIKEIAKENNIEL